MAVITYVPIVQQSHHLNQFRFVENADVAIYLYVKFSFKVSNRISFNFDEDSLTFGATRFSIVEKKWMIKIPFNQFENCFFGISIQFWPDAEILFSYVWEFQFNGGSLLYARGLFSMFSLLCCCEV